MFTLLFYCGKLFLTSGRTLHLTNKKPDVQIQTYSFETQKPKHTIKYTYQNSPVRGSNISRTY